MSAGEKTRAVVLAAVMVLSVFAAGIAFTGGGAAQEAGGNITAPNSTQFGDVGVGFTENATVTLGNDGNAPVNVTETSISGDNASAFEVVEGGAEDANGSFTLGANETRDLMVEFTPSTAGDNSADLTVDTAEDGTETVDLSGNATQLLDVSISPNAANRTTQVTTLGGVNGSNVPPAQIPEGQDELAIQRLIVQSNGGLNFSELTLLPTPVAGVDVNGDDPGTAIDRSVFFQLEGQPTVINNGSALVIDFVENDPVVVEAGDEIVVQTNIGNGVRTGDEPGNYTLESRLRADGGPDEIGQNITPVGTGEFTVGPATVGTIDSADTQEFGEDDLSETSGPERDVTFRNTGNGTVVVDDVSLGGEDPGAFYTGLVSTFSLEPGETRNVTVFFNRAETPGQKSATLTASTTKDGTATTNLSGTAVGGVVEAPDSAEFGNVTASETATQTVTVNNTGNAPVNVTETSVGGANASAFSVTDGGANFTLDPNESQDVTVEFAPDSAGERTADLTVDTAEDGSATTALSGTGEAAPEGDITAPDSQDFGEVTVGETATETVTVTNDGDAAVDVTETAVSDSDAFSVADGGADFSLEPGASQDVTVQFAPDSPGDESATLTVDTAEDGSATTDLSGTGVEAEDPGPEPGPNVTELDVTVEPDTSGRPVGLTVLGGVNGSNVLEVPGEDDTAQFDRFVVQTNGGLNLSNVAPTPLPQFGIDEGGDEPGNETDIDIIAAGLDGLPTVSDNGSRFEVRINNPVNITEGDELVVKFQEANNVIGGPPGNYTLEAEAITVNNTSAPRSTGPYEIEPVQAVAEIDTVPDDLDYGEVAENASVFRNVTIENEGNATLTVENTTIVGPDAEEFQITANDAQPGGFLAPDRDIVVEPNESAEVTVRFRPNMTGPKEATFLAKRQTGNGSATTNLSGTSVPRGDIESSVFETYGNVSVGETATQNVLLTNIDSGPVDITDVSLGAGDADQFEVVGGADEGTTIAPGETVAVAAEFAPTSQGQQSVALNVDTRVSGSTTTVLVGTGVEADDEPVGANNLTIVGVDGLANYEFSATENVSEADGTVEQQFSDEIDGKTASGVVGPSRDSYTFSGELIRLDVDGEARVLLNGEEIDPADYPDNILRVTGDGETVRYEFSASSATVSEAADSVEQQFGDEIDGKTASGFAGPAQDIYGFNGELIRLEVSGQGTVTLNGEEIDPADYPDNILTVSGVGEIASYEFTASGNVGEFEGTVERQFADEIEGTTASGVVGPSDDSYTFAGELLSLSVEGNANVTVNGAEVDESEV